ncbi:MAG: dephospho-CoA kinase [Nitrospinales bacterium]
MSLLVGLTGGMGSGKTLAASMFRNLGAHILDADAICRDLVKPREPAWSEIVEFFGKEILTADETLDRARLGKIVFDDPGKKKVLESILHPRVFLEERRVYANIRKKQADALVIIDAALLIESGNYKNMDKVVVMSCGEKEQLRRTLKKGLLSPENIAKRLRAQMSNDDKIKYADYVIRNEGSVDNLRIQVESVFQKLKNLAASNQSTS